MSARTGGRAGPLRWAPWLAMAVLAGAALVVGTLDAGGPRSNADRVLDLTRSIGCPQCDGQAVADSDVEVSREIRRDVTARVAEGQRDDEILAYYASTYGDDMLLTPPARGVSGLVWVLPVAALLAALVGLAAAFRRWSARPAPRATEDDRVRVEAALRGEGVGGPEPEDGR